MTPSPVLYPKITIKLCVKCKIEKPVEDFAKYSKGKHGLHSYCKTCKLADDRERAEKRAEKVREYQRLEYLKIEPLLRPTDKVCSNPECAMEDIFQPPENFRKSRIHRTGLMPDCLLCEKRRKRLSYGRHKASSNAKARGKYKDNPEIAAYRKRWYEEHKVELNKRTKEWRDANPEECRRLHIERRFRNYGVTPEWYSYQLAKQDGGCAICGGNDPKNRWGTFNIDHDHSCCSKSCHACDNCRRGLLCSPCNIHLAHLEKLEWTHKAIAYINQYKVIGSSNTPPTCPEK